MPGAAFHAPSRDNVSRFRYQIKLGLLHSSGYCYRAWSWPSSFLPLLPVLAQVGRFDADLPGVIVDLTCAPVFDALGGAVRGGGRATARRAGHRFYAELVDCHGGWFCGCSFFGSCFCPRRGARQTLKPQGFQSLRSVRPSLSLGAFGFRLFYRFPIPWAFRIPATSV